MDKWLISKTKTSGDSEDAGSTAAGQPSGRMETTETKHSQRKKRKYTETYLQYGFTLTDIHNEQRPICLICNAVLASESMKPAKLKRHLDTNHASYANKPVEYFERLLQSTKKQKSYMEAHVFTNSKHLQASYEASYLIAKAKKPFTIGEELALPIAIRITEIINGKKYADELRKIPMSDTTVSRRILEISKDQFEQLLERIKENSKFAIQLDETTDIANMAQLLVYVRYCHNDNVHEDLLCCRPLEGHTTGEAIFQKVDDCFKEVGLNWTDCVGVCTDGAAAMTGKNVGFHTKVKSVSNGGITFTHCMIHREVLATKKLSEELNAVLQDSVKIINYIKSRALNTRLFSNFCKDMGSDFNSLLFHTEVRWLSRGRALRRLVVLKDEVMLFLSDNNSDLLKYFQTENWLCKLCYLSDILDKLNELNISLQGGNTNVFTLISKIQAFMKKINIWLIKVKNNSYEMFSCMEDFITENELSFEVIKPIIIDHLVSLESNLKKYFVPELDVSRFDWIQNPFDVEIGKVCHLSLEAQEEFAELSCDSTLKIYFSRKSLNSFWIGIKSEHPILSQLAMGTLLPFASTYLCETAFSALTNIKTKHRSSLTNIEMVLRPAITKIEPRFDLLCQKMQAHQSH